MLWSAYAAGMPDRSDHSAFNRRAFTRVTIGLEATVTQNGRPWSATTHDLSFQGLFLSTARELSPHTPLQVHLEPPGGAGLAAIDLEVEVLERRVLPDGTGGLACRITTIHEPESYEHLRRFVLYNADDPDQARREIDRFLEDPSSDPA